MAAEIPRVRPAVISEGTRDALDEYQGFRHIVRHVYTFKFDPVKVQWLVEEASSVFANCVRSYWPSLTSWGNQGEHHVGRSEL